MNRSAVIFLTAIVLIAGGAAKQLLMKKPLSIGFEEEIVFTVYSHPESFFVLEDPTMNERVNAVRTEECDGVDRVLSEAKRRFENRSEAQKRDRQFAQTLVFALTQKEVRQRTMSRDCLVHVSEGGLDEHSFWALLNPKGDVVIGYHAMAAYSYRYSVEPDKYVLNVIAFGEGNVLEPYDMVPVGDSRIKTASVD